ncbi:MAG TPA: FMN-binding protein, partial [Noviherbaspirillum sp.]|nr:FMN-binding protein [Noviherbaspirillum sp.]
MKRFDSFVQLLSRLLALMVASLSFLLAPQATLASMYDSELTPEKLSGPDLCALAPCGEVIPGAQKFSQRKGMPPYVEAYATENGADRLLGYVFLSTDIVDIPAYSGKPIVTLIGMDTRGTITGVRILKHSEPILLLGIPESTLVEFIGQYLGKQADAKLEVGQGGANDGTISLDGVSGATVTVIAENQAIMRSAYAIASQVGIIKSVPKPAARFTPIDERLNWAAMLKEGSIQHLQVQPEEVGVESNGKPYIDLYFGYLNVPSIGKSVL